MRHLGPGDEATWPRQILPGDPRFNKPEPPHSKVSAQVDVLAGRRPCDELGRDFDDLACLVEYESLDSCGQSRNELLALVAKYRDEAPVAFQNLTNLLEQAQ